MTKIKILAFYWWWC